VKLVRQRKLLKKYSGILLIAIGLICLIIAFVIYHNQPRQPKTTNKVNSVNVQTAPSSKKLSTIEVSSYSVPAQDPKYISIPAINISSTPILSLGLLKGGAISTPDNIYETGWYQASALPGQSGAMFIYGHVSSWTADGIFYNLKKLVAGDPITITRGDNKTYTYKVVSTKIYPYNNVNMQQVLSPIDSSKPGLNLMTCTGSVIKGTSEFNERLVVFTSLSS
jgi:sortase (surface protein transpeptidase)